MLFLLAVEKLFVDYAGQTVPVIDRHSGEVRQPQVFVAVLGASSYTRRGYVVAAVAGLAGLPRPLLRLPRRGAGDRGAG